MKSITCNYILYKDVAECKISTKTAKTLNMFVQADVIHKCSQYESCHEKTCLGVFRPVPTQNGL